MRHSVLRFIIRITDSTTWIFLVVALITISIFAGAIFAEDSSKTAFETSVTVFFALELLSRFYAYATLQTRYNPRAADPERRWIPDSNQPWTFLNDPFNLLDVGVRDDRRVEVTASGLTVHKGAQLAVNATLVSPLKRCGHARLRP